MGDPVADPVVWLCEHFPDFADWQHNIVAAALRSPAVAMPMLSEPSAGLSGRTLELLDLVERQLSEQLDELLEDIQTNNPPHERGNP